MNIQFFITLSLILVWSMESVTAADFSFMSAVEKPYNPTPAPFYYPYSRLDIDKPEVRNPLEKKARKYDQEGVQETIDSENIDSILAIAYIYKDMNKSETALKLLKAANNIAFRQDIRLESKARTYLGELILANASSKEDGGEEGATLIVDAAIEDDDPDAIAFLLRQNKDFEKYIGNEADSEVAKNALLKVLFKK